MNPDNTMMMRCNDEASPLNPEEAEMFVDLMEEVNPTNEPEPPQQVREQNCSIDECNCRSATKWNDIVYSLTDIFTIFTPFPSDHLQFQQILSANQPEEDEQNLHKEGSPPKKNSEKDQAVETKTAEETPQCL